RAAGRAERLLAHPARAVAPFVAVARDEAFHARTRVRVAEQTARRAILVRDAGGAAGTVDTGLSLSAVVVSTALQAHALIRARPRLDHAHEIGARAVERVLTRLGCLARTTTTRGPLAAV